MSERTLQLFQKAAEEQRVIGLEDILTTFHEYERETRKYEELESLGDVDFDSYFGGNSPYFKHGRLVNFIDGNTNVVLLYADDNKKTLDAWQAMTKEERIAKIQEVHPNLTNEEAAHEIKEILEDIIKAPMYTVEIFLFDTNTLMQYSQMAFIHRNKQIDLTEIVIMDEMLQIYYPLFDVVVDENTNTITSKTNNTYSDDFGKINLLAIMYILNAFK